jgi:hypothetical protein
MFILQNIDNKGDYLQDIVKDGVMACLSSGRHNPEALDSDSIWFNYTLCVKVDVVYTFGSTGGGDL